MRFGALKKKWDLSSELKLKRMYTSAGMNEMTKVNAIY